MIEKLPHEVIEAMLDSLPGEISFVDKDDKVRYFNKNGKRIFPRPRTIIGRKVQDCHKPENVPEVNRILNELRSGRQIIIEGWADANVRPGHKIYNSYVAVRDEIGGYLGSLVIAKDMTELLKVINQGGKK